jgi:succinate-semialdehyde dehydrogenase/glutarate-semialdehyde dehydrogenase
LPFVTAVEIPLLQRRAYVAGKWIEADSGETFPVLDPATGDTLAEVPRLGAAETRRALAAAEHALPEWKSRTAKERARVLRRLADLMLEREEDLARLMVLEQGKPLAEARAEVSTRPPSTSGSARRRSGSTETPSRARGRTSGST